ncbi:hypothetical protein ACQ4PT_006171 [Festuca glaucescens]
MALVLPRPPAAQIDEVLQQVADHIVDNLHWEVFNFAESTIGLGLYCLVDQVTRDLLVVQPQIPFGFGRTLSFVHHDEWPNFHASIYTSLGWIMLLNLPMDYRNEEFLCETVGKFGKMRGWFRADPSPTRTLIKCAYAGARDVLRSIVVRDPQRHGGTIVSWTVPVYIMLTDQADVLPGDESPVPHDDNPHPLPSDDASGDEDWIPDDVEPEMPGWGQWNNEATANNAGQGGWDHHVPLPVQEQSMISVQFSGSSVSSVHFVQAEGPQQVIEVPDNVEPVELVEPVGMQQEIAVPVQDVVIGAHGIVADDTDDVVVGNADLAMDTEDVLPDANPLAIVPFVPPQVQGGLQVELQLSPVLPDQDAGPPLDTITPDTIVSVKKRPRKQKEAKVVDVIDLGSRRCTRSISQNDGYKLVPVIDKPETRKKPRYVKPKGYASSECHGTPIMVLQQASKWLEIADKDLSVDKLTAHPQPKESSGSND